MPTPSVKDRFVVLDRDSLLDLIEKAIKTEEPLCNLNDLDVSKISDFRGVFFNSPLMGDISEWDLSSATRLDRMTQHAWLQEQALHLAPMDTIALPQLDATDEVGF